ncbi:hypothetical protein RRG08_006334 [Elysia crispata]|uniref:C-type lectin domain-containing protein n=1 Tax=Elysia crispata TaxID=231223 RepID=A0AAE0YQE1_9GAST|nr:hypothetical protein RRG08_006334 [Elysia crispata]
MCWGIKLREDVTDSGFETYPVGSSQYWQSEVLGDTGAFFWNYQISRGTSGERFSPRLQSQQTQMRHFTYQIVILHAASINYLCLISDFQLCISLKASCPPGWFTSKTSRSCIKLFLSKKSWDNARKACQAQGADLLINYNKEKEKLIYEERDTLVREKFWIGLNDRNHEGDFTWLDDRQKITNVPWYRGEPNNYRNRQDCVLVNKKRNKEASLFDRECSYAIFFICEFSLENACDKITGSCISGCDEGYQGQRCDVQLCPPMWRASKTSRSCVKLFLSKKSWGDARKACQAHGADLLINYNQEKEKLIYDFR